jgi:hypothetical protein
MYWSMFAGFIPLPYVDIATRRFAAEKCWPISQNTTVLHLRRFV